MNIEQIEFRAKDKFTREWVKGDFLRHMQDGPVIVTGNGTYEIDIETIGMKTTSHCYNNRPLYEHDIVFEETEEDFGDSRTYFVVAYIEEWARFALLDYSQYNDYLMNGTNFFDEDLEYSMADVEKMHYAGNYFDNRDILSQDEFGDEIHNYGVN